jgi:hypothetical protein
MPRDIAVCLMNYIKNFVHRQCNTIVSLAAYSSEAVAELSCGRILKGLNFIDLGPLITVFIHLPIKRQSAPLLVVFDRPQRYIATFLISGTPLKKSLHNLVPPGRG